MVFNDLTSASPSATQSHTNSQIGRSATADSVLSTPADQKLRRAAGEFEGMLLSSLWKSMKSTFATPDDDDDGSSDPAHDTLDDMSIQTMCDAVGKAGGLGLGKLILKHLEPMLAHAESQKGTATGPLSGQVSAPPADSTH